MNIILDDTSEKVHKILVDNQITDQMHVEEKVSP